MMSRPLGAKVHYHHNPLMLISKSPCNTASTRSSWYDDDDDDDDDNNNNDDKNDDLSLSSYSLSVTRENTTAPCWGGWLLKWTTHRPKPSQQQQQLQLLQRAIRKPSLKVVVSSSSTTSDDSEIDHDDEESCGNNSRCLTPPCPPIVSFPNGRDHDDEEEEDEEVALGCGDEMHLIRSLEIDGDRFEQEGLLFEAWNVYQRLLELLRATGQSANRIGNVHYRTGMIQYKRNCINEALCHFDQALFIYQLNYNPDDCHENHQDDDNESEEPYDADTDMALDFYRVYVATGHVHLTNQNPYRAIEYFQRALPFVVVTPEPNTTDAVTATVATVAVSKQQRSRRHDTYDRYYVQVLHALGTAYEAIGDDTEAQLQYQKAAAVLRT